MAAKLTPRQLAFVREYPVDMNATAAAERAGYGGGKGGASVAGCRLLADSRIGALIGEALNQRAARVELSADRVLQEVARLALADPLLAFNDDGTLKPLKDIPEDLRRCLAGVELRQVDGEKTATITKVKFWDKRASLELAMKHLGLLKDKLELGGEGGAPLQIVVKTYREDP